MKTKKGGVQTIIAALGFILCLCFFTGAAASQNQTPGDDNNAVTTISITAEYGLSIQPPGEKRSIPTLYRGSEGVYRRTGAGVYSSSSAIQSGPIEIEWNNSELRIVHYNGGR